MEDLLDLLQRAALSLAQAGSIKERLADAYDRHLMHVDADDLPEPWRDEFLMLTGALRRETPLRGESPIRASVRKMSNEEAERHAAQVVAIFGAVARQSAGQQPRRLPRSPTMAPIVKLFAADA